MTQTLPPYSIRDVRLTPGETRFVDGWLLVRSRRHLFIASPPPNLRLWAQANTCRRASIDPKLLWEGKGLIEAATAHSPRDIGYWRVDEMALACPRAVVDELKYKLDGCRHILREAGYPAVAPLLEPLGALGFALLELASREPGFVDLIAQNPALAVGLLWLRPASGPGIEEVRSWKQRDLAARLGFEPAAARMLSRVVPSAITVERLDLLRRLPLESRTGLAGLRHACAINALTFTLLAEEGWRTRLADRLFHEVGDLPPDKADAFSWLLISILRTMKQRGNPLPELRSFKDLARLFSVAFPLAAYLHSKEADWERRKSHFDPPLPGGPGIEPLETVEAILEEGRLQRNCIDLDAVRRVQRGGAFFYRVTEPSRCSLLITRDRRRIGGWAIREFKAFANREPDAPTLAAVRTWFASVTGTVLPESNPASPVDGPRRVWEVGKAD